MWNPVTNQVSDMCEVVFLQRMFCQRENSEEVMKEPTVMLQVPCRNDDGNADSNDGVVIQEKGVLNPNEFLV